MILFQQDGKSVSGKIQLWKRVIAGKLKQSIWQTSFYDHVIRDEADYLVKWNYIEENPIKWVSDEYDISCE